MKVHICTYNTHAYITYDKGLPEEDFGASISEASSCAALAEFELGPDSPNVRMYVFMYVEHLSVGAGLYLTYIPEREIGPTPADRCTPNMCIMYLCM
jgi:hypothetical protein